MKSIATSTRVALVAGLTSLGFFFGSAKASDNNFLTGSLYEKHAVASNIDPLLLYSVSLKESGKYLESENATYPHQLVVRSPEGSKYFNNIEDADAYLEHALSKFKKWEIDVCAMQINLKWNGHLVQHDYSSLFDMETCLKAGSSALKIALESTDDIELAIGRYHVWKDENRARQYGREAIAIWNALKKYSGK